MSYRKCSWCMEYSPMYNSREFYPNAGTNSIHGYLELFFIFQKFWYLKWTTKFCEYWKHPLDGGVHHFDQTTQFVWLSKIGGLQKVGALNINHPILGALNIQSTFLEPIFWELFEYPSSKKVAFVKKAASREQHQQQQLSSGWRYGGKSSRHKPERKSPDFPLVFINLLPLWNHWYNIHIYIQNISYIYIYYTQLLYIYILDNEHIPLEKKQLAV